MIKSKDDYMLYLEQDKRNLKIRKASIIDYFFPNVIWQFQKTLRKVEYLTNTKNDILSRALLIWYRIKLRRLKLRLGFSIPINVFGPGLSIAHYGNIVVNSKARIGSNCRIHSGVNVGASGGKEAPIIGDNVYLGPGAIVFGSIEIANNVTIGANATVNKSFNEEYCVLAGTPAKIVKHTDNNWLDMNGVKH